MFGCMFLTRRPISAKSSSSASGPTSTSIHTDHSAAIKFSDHKQKPNNNQMMKVINHHPRKFHQPHLPHVENVSIAVYPSSGSAKKWKIVSMALAALLVAHFLYSVFGEVRVGNPAAGDCLLSFGPYMGHQYRSQETVSRKCLFESKWIRIQQHEVQFGGTESSSSSVLDWLWIDSPDRVNVLVEAPPSSGADQEQHQRQFYILETSSQYALEGRTSLAVVSGTINKGERHEIAAARQVEAELQLKCEEMQILGRFRSDVNRGMGWVTSYLAADCKPMEGVPEHITRGGRRLGAVPEERKDLKLMSLEDLRESARNGAFIEVQWSNTVAMALLHPEMAPSN